MRSFLAKHWLLIVVPMLVVAALVALLLALGEGDPSAGFQYGL